MAIERFSAALLRSALEAGHALLRAHEDLINAINVYPVADGDTGTNMAATLQAVAERLHPAGAMRDTCDAIRLGSLLGARGNSGIILAQILAGLAGRLSGEERGADGWALAAAPTASRSAAYTGVLEPVEGTMLTVIAAAADAASRRGDGTLPSLGAPPLRRRTRAQAVRAGRCSRSSACSTPAPTP